MPTPTDQKFAFRFRGRAYCPALMGTPRDVAAGRLAKLRAYAAEGIVRADIDPVTYVRTGKLAPLADRPPPRPAAAPPAPPEWTLSRLFDWALNRPAALEKHDRLGREQEASHLNNLVRSVGWFLAVIDPAAPPPVTPAMLQQFIDARQTNPKLQPAGKPGAATLRKDVGNVSACYNRWARLHQFPPLTRPALEYPAAAALPPFRPVSDVVAAVARHGLTGAAARREWHASFPTVDEAAAILEHVRAVDPQPWLPAVVAAAIYTGCRASEARRARVHDWDVPGGTWRVREHKRNKDTETVRVVAVHPALAAAMADWFRVRPASDYLFCRTQDSEFGYGVGDKIGPGQLSAAFESALAGQPWADLPGLHRFRHGFRSNALSAGVSERLVDAVVGHTTEDCRRRYTHATTKTMADAVKTIFGDAG